MSDVRLYDESYPPSVYPVKGATAGIPGSWSPANGRVPADAAQANQWGVVATPQTAWTSGQYVQGTTSGAAGRMTWTGSVWVGGAAPLDEGDEAPRKRSTPPKGTHKR